MRITPDFALTADCRWGKNGILFFFLTNVLFPQCGQQQCNGNFLLGLDFGAMWGVRNVINKESFEVTIPKSYRAASFFFFGFCGEVGATA